jgi:hypothetical protein
MDYKIEIINYGVEITLPYNLRQRIELWERK